MRLGETIFFSRIKTAFIAAFIFSMIAVPVSARAQTGQISGKAVDEATGDPMIGATIRLKESGKGAYTNVNGEFKLDKVPVGEYTLVISYMGYQTLEYQGVKVIPGETTKIDAALAEEGVTTDEVEVSAKRYTHTDAALLADRQKAEAVSDAIGAEAIARGGAGDAADAVKKVTGATTVGGKHVYIRGLGERYSSTQLNGANLPSADPDKKSVHLDLFPADLIDNITTIKTATPDKPGDFTGGTVDIRTKSFPDKLKMNFSMSTSYNFSSTGETMLTYNGSGTDWIGFDDGKRDIPDVVQNVINDPNQSVPYLSETWSDPERAYLLDRLSRAFDPEMAPTNQTAPMDYGFSISAGDNFKQKLGYLASFSYGRKVNSYNGGIHARYSVPGVINDSTRLNNDVMVDDSKSDDEIVWGGMVNLGYNITPHNQISFNYMRTQSGASTTRYQEGWDRYYGDVTYQTRVLQYTQRDVNSFQLTGKHNFSFLKNIKLDWIASYNGNTQWEPDLRFFTNDYSVGTDQDTSYYIDQSLYKYPSRYFRDLNEDIASISADIEVPIKEFVPIKMKFKTGLSFQDKNRSFKEHRFDMAQDRIDYNGEDYAFFSDYTGIIDSSSSYRFGNYIQYYDPNAASYNGDQTITAFYGMVDWFIVDDFRVVTGVRYETTQMEVGSLDTNKANKTGLLDEQDILPSVNFVYSLNQKMNLRAAYGKTLARPNFRELAPYSSFEYVGGYIFLGNDSLQRTLINNFDLRWEWFTNPGEIFAASVFYKDFKDPIERTILNVNDEIQYKNVGEAFVYGAEFELRKGLNFLHPFFDNFLFGANLTLVRSQVDVPETELEIKRSFDSSAATTRDLQGQSPYVLNLDLLYTNREWGTEANLHFYTFGKRLSEVSRGGTPDVYEYPSPDLNFVVSQRLFDKFKLKFKAQNILNSERQKAMEFKGEKYVIQEYDLGASVSFSVSYTLQ